MLVCWIYSYGYCFHFRARNVFLHNINKVAVCAGLCAGSTNLGFRDGDFNKSYSDAARQSICFVFAQTLVLYHCLRISVRFDSTLNLVCFQVSV